MYNIIPNNHGNNLIAFDYCNLYNYVYIICLFEWSYIFLFKIVQGRVQHS